MAGYAIGEAALEAVIKTASGFTVGNVGRGKWNLLNQGKAAKYAILQPGEATRVVGPGTDEFWSTIVQVWHLYKDDGTTLTDLEADVETIISKIDADPDLSDSTGYVRDSNITRVGAAVRRWTASGGPVWLCQDITVEWHGFRTRTFS